MSGAASKANSPPGPVEVSSTRGDGNTPNNQQEGAPGNATQRTLRAKNPKNPQDTKAFKGATVKMNGCVFQLHTERKSKSQFADTMEALRIYASTAFKNGIESLTPPFTDLKEPKVAEPEGPEEEIVT